MVAITLKKLIPLLLILVGGFAAANAAINYEVIFKTDAIRLSSQTITTLVDQAMQSSTLSQYSKGYIFVYSKQEGAEDYFVLDLYKDNTLGFKSYRLDYYDSKIVCVTEDYIEESPLDSRVCGTCPDPDVEVIIAYITQFNMIKPACVKAGQDFNNAGIKTVMLEDNQENKTSILNYLSCPKLKVWTRIAHGTQGAIGLGSASSGVRLTTKDVTTAPFKDVIKGKFYPFTSCYVGGNQNTFGKGLISAGGLWMCAGDDVEIQAPSGTSTWSKFIPEVIIKKAEIIATFNKYMKNAADKWRFQSSGAGSYYVFGQTTVSSEQTVVSQNSLSIFCSPQSVTFNSVNGALAIFNASGKRIFKTGNVGTTYVWDKSADGNTQIGTGTYIAVIDQGMQGMTAKPFTIAK
ncbi:MAG: hypothetical protein JW795_11285 [Chitinivibrionales bacterium]|nr:hypothetical protein [Chitinivibrionales bacterium]